MSKDLIYQNSLEIKADKAKVWDALINPEITCRYMFGCEAHSDWKLGSPLIWKGAEDGVVYVKGEVVKFDPGNVLAYTSISPESEQGESSDDYLTVEYHLSDAENYTRLDIIQSGFPDNEEGHKRFEETKEAWEMVMEGFRSILEP